MADVRCRVVLGRLAVARLEPKDAGLVVADIDAPGRESSRGRVDRRFRITDAIEMQAVQIVTGHQMSEHVHGVGLRIRMAKIEVPLRAVTLPVERRAGPVVRQRSRGPLTRIGMGEQGAGGHVPEVLSEDVPSIPRQPGDGRVRIVDGANDHECVDLDAAGVRLLNEVPERIERPGAAGARFADAGRLRQRFERIEIPRVPAPADLRKQRVGLAVDSRADHAIDIGVRPETRVERLDPVGAVLRCTLRDGGPRNHQRAHDDDSDQQVARGGELGS